MLIVFFLVMDKMEGTQIVYKWLWGAVYGCPYDYTKPFFIQGIGGIWFLMALFWAKILFNDILDLSECLQLIVVVSLFVLGNISYSVFVLPESIQNALMALIFIWCGYIIRKYEILDKINTIWIFLLVFFWVSGIIGKYGFITMVNCQISSPFAPLTAVCGSLVIIMLSKIYISKLKYLSKALSYFGKMSMVILCFHIFELHTGIIVRMVEYFFSSNSMYLIFIMRLIYAIIITRVVLRIPLFRKVFGLNGIFNL